MKSNLISAIAGWKSAALLALVAMVAAVAFSGVLTTGQSADAQTPLADDTADTTPGGKVTVDTDENAAGDVDIMEFKITGGTSTGSFANGEQTIVCSDRDTSTTPTTNPGSTCDTTDGAGITVVLTVDEDSPDGYIIVTRNKILPVEGESPPPAVITVTTQPKPASLAIKPASTTVAAKDDDTTDALTPHRTAVTATVKDDQSPSAGMVGQLVTFQTNLGTLECPESPAAGALPQIAAVTNVQWCQVRTVAADDTATPPVVAGTATVTLVGGGLPGTATLTARHASLGAQTADVTLYGDAANLAAESEQGSVEIGGSVFVVLTVTDEAGNPVSGATITPLTAKEVTGPSDDASTVKVVTTKDTPIPTTDPFDTAAGVGYSKDKVGATAADNIPACGEDNTDTDALADGTLTETFASEGTNDKGQCVVEVTAPEDVDGTPANEAATRGEHTVNFQISEKITASVTITVAGAPSAIEDDAPDYVDPLSDTKITVTVRDDEDVLVGEVPVAIIKLAGDGIVENASAMTDNGTASFSYAAGRAGEAAFRVIAGEGPTAPRLLIVVNVGEPPEEEPEGPAPTWSEPLVSGWNQVAWHGEDGASVGDNVGEGVTAVHQWNTGTQSWESWFAGTEGVPTTVNDFSELEYGGIYWVYSE